MKILIPVAAYHDYNTAVYVEKAFQALGHTAHVITQHELYECAEDSDADLFFGVDSAGPLDFPEVLRGRSAMWFIDSRHNCNPDRRNPPDNVVAKQLHDAGGWTFLAQSPDWLRFVNEGIRRSCWLPLAADVDVWKPYSHATIEFEVGFYGNIWCEQRRQILDQIRSEFDLLQIVGDPQNCAHAMSKCRVIFNVSGWYGTDIAYDINMRVFEAMACGRPLVTNWLPELTELGFQTAWHMFTYNKLSEIPNVLKAAMSPLCDPEGVAIRAREFIMEGHTYVHRMAEALDVLEAGGVCPNDG